MNYRVLGRTGLRISEIGLGSWLTYGKSVAEEAAVACVQAAFDAGVNFFDTADVYAAGQAELLLGKAIRALPRNQIVVGTKCYFRMWPGPLGFGLNRKHIFESVEGSLRRLGVDYVDLLQTHYPDKDTPAEETLRAMDDLRRQGKILYAACSNYYAHELAEAMLAAQRLGVTRFDSLQPEYSMLFRHVETHDLPFCGRHGIGVVCYSPLAEGILTGKYKSAGKGPAGTRLAERKSPHLTRENLARIRRLEPIAKARGCTLGQLALAWVLRRPEVTCAITGASRPEQIAQNVAACEIKLTDAELEQIEKALGNKPVKPW
ncbi:MAG: L-glyceraldehyde 3-phosphate reductase [Phycisphaerae bacterium]|nr:L-glyceraldehyde 3-phosphate reductase [Phycisphaerae bacterium]